MEFLRNLYTILFEDIESYNSNKIIENNIASTELFKNESSSLHSILINLENIKNNSELNSKKGDDLIKLLKTYNEIKNFSINEESFLNDTMTESLSKYTNNIKKNISNLKEIINKLITEDKKNDILITNNLNTFNINLNMLNNEKNNFFKLIDDIEQNLVSKHSYKESYVDYLINISNIHKYNEYKDFSNFTENFQISESGYNSLLLKNNALNELLLNINKIFHKKKYIDISRTLEHKIFNLEAVLKKDIKSLYKDVNKSAIIKNNIISTHKFITDINLYNFQIENNYYEELVTNKYYINKLILNIKRSNLHNKEILNNNLDNIINLSNENLSSFINNFNHKLYLSYNMLLLNKGSLYYKYGLNSLYKNIKDKSNNDIYSFSLNFLKKLQYSNKSYKNNEYCSCLVDILIDNIKDLENYIKLLQKNKNKQLLEHKIEYSNNELINNNYLTFRIQYDISNIDFNRIYQNAFNKAFINNYTTKNNYNLKIMQKKYIINTCLELLELEYTKI